MNDDPESLNRRVKEILNTSDTMEVVEFLHRAEDPITVMKVYRDLLMHLYWKEKNLPVVISLAHAGIQYGLTYETGKGSDELRYDLRGLAKTLAYNLASFTWPGWDEPGITLCDTVAAVGRDAARLNLRLAVEQNKGDLPMCRGHWILGAHLLVIKDEFAAREQFEESARFAERAESVAEVWLARGFAALARWLDSPGDERTLTEIRDHLSRLEGLDHGAEFRKQILTAARVFGAELPPV